MDLHVNLDDEEVQYLQSIGLTDNIEEALSEVGKALHSFSRDVIIQSRVAKLVAYVWLAITPFKIAIGLKVRGVLESSHH